MVVALILLVAVLAALVVGAARGGRRQGTRVRIHPGAANTRAGELMAEWVAPLDGVRVAAPSRITDAAAPSVGRPLAQDAMVGTADGLIFATEAWLSVDPAVFQAAAQTAHAPVDHLLALIPEAHLQTWADATAGQQHALAGHVGEFIALRHLQDAGLAPHMAELSNQQGWDATIAGHSFNFKDYADFHSPGIAQHFADNPGVPIVVPGDIGHLPADALHIAPGEHLNAADLAQHKVIAVDAWHHADAADAMQHAYEQLDPGMALHHAAELLAGGHLLDAAGVLDAHLPLVTTDLSGYREFGLLNAGDTELARAAKNVGLDVGGVAGGGVAGHWAGAGIGMAVAGPPGAVVGGLLGGILGAVSGKIAAGEVRSRPLKSATSDYETARDHLLETASHVEADAKQAWERASGEVTAQYESNLASLVEVYDAFATEQRELADASAKVTPEQATAALRASKQAAARLPAVPPATRTWWTQIPGLRAIGTWMALRQLRRDLTLWEDESKRRADQGDLTELLDALVAVPGTDAEVRDLVATALAVRTSAYHAVTQAAAQTQAAALGMRASAQEDLSSRWERVQADVDVQLTPAREGMDAASDRLLKELKAAGKPPE